MDLPVLKRTVQTTTVSALVKELQLERAKKKKANE